MRNLLTAGPCGVGRSFLARALRQKACCEDLSVVYHRACGCSPCRRSVGATAANPKMLRTLPRADLFLIDNWGLEMLDADRRRDPAQRPRWSASDRYGGRLRVGVPGRLRRHTHRLFSCADKMVQDSWMERLVEGAAGAVGVAPDDSSHQRGQRANADPYLATGPQPFFATQIEASGRQVDDDGRDPRCAGQPHVCSQIGCDAIFSADPSHVHTVVACRHFFGQLRRAVAIVRRYQTKTNTGLRSRH